MSKRAMAVLFACFWIVLAHFAIRYSYGTLLPEMLPVLSITKAQAGMVYSSYFIAYTVLSPVLGLMADRYDMRVLLSAFMVVMGGGAFLMQFSSTGLQAGIFFTITGIGCAAGWAPVMALAQRWISDKRRGLSLSLIDAGSSLGVIAAGALIPVIVAAADWRFAWTCLGIMGFALGVYNFFAIRNYPKNQEKPAAVKTGGRGKLVGMTYKQLLTDRRFWFIGIAYLLTGFVVIIPFTFLSTYAVQELSFSYESAALLITVIGAGGMIGKLTLGAISDKIGRIRVMAICAILITVGSLGMAFGRGWMLTGITFVYGIGYGACWALYAACASDFFSRQAAGGIIGLWTFLMGIGSIIAPAIAGWSADISGTLFWAFIIAMAAGLISLVLLLPMLRVPQVSMVKDQ